jgi:hypothetical protein
MYNFNKLLEDFEAKLSSMTLQERYEYLKGYGFALKDIEEVNKDSIDYFSKHVCDENCLDSHNYCLADPGCIVGCKKYQEFVEDSSTLRRKVKTLQGDRFNEFKKLVYEFSSLCEKQGELVGDINIILHAMGIPFDTEEFEIAWSHLEGDGSVNEVIRYVKEQLEKVK